MLKEFIIATALTIVFSIGVGVLFVRTVYDLINTFIKDSKKDTNTYPNKANNLQEC